MKIELRKLADIISYDRNPRQNDDAVEAVAKSIRGLQTNQALLRSFFQQAELKR